MMSQTIALFIDAYRELNAKKLFWITMGISVLVVIAFGCVGFNAKGWSILIWSFEDANLNSQKMSPLMFYRFVYTTFAIPIWLTWAATILALISTASIIPDFVSGGAIELSLSKPISRVRLILTKYLTGLIFATLQVAAFSVSCFFVIGVRAKAWDSSLFLAIPIVVLFFSYLYCFCALMGLLTRSTIAAILITIGFWVFIFILNVSEHGFLTARVTNELRQEKLVAMIENLKAQRKQIEDQAKAENREIDPAVLHTNDASLAKRQGQLDTAKENSKIWIQVHSILYGVKTVVPKTNETVGLLNRYLLTSKELEQLHGDDQEVAFGGPSDDVKISAKRLQRRMDTEARSRTLTWVIGTSLAFEVSLVGLMVWRFKQRDY